MLTYDFQLEIYNWVQERSTAEIMAIFIDRQLKMQVVDKISQQDLDDYIIHVIALFNTLDDKDVFMNLFH